ncbi:MAG: hypothetical protein ACYDDZ_11010 [Acidimicrobiales bacterium]
MGFRNPLYLAPSTIGDGVAVFTAETIASGKNFTDTVLPTLPGIYHSLQLAITPQATGTITVRLYDETNGGVQMWRVNITDALANEVNPYYYNVIPTGPGVMGLKIAVQNSTASPCVVSLWAAPDQLPVALVSQVQPVKVTDTVNVTVLNQASSGPAPQLLEASLSKSVGTGAVLLGAPLPCGVQLVQQTQGTFNVLPSLAATLTLATNPAPGNVLIATIGVSALPSSPGWTLFAAPGALAILYRVVLAGDPASWTFTFTNPNNFNPMSQAIGVFEFSGVNTSAPLDDLESENGPGTGGSFTMANAPTTPASLLLNVFAIQPGSPVSTFIAYDTSVGTNLAYSGLVFLWSFDSSVAFFLGPPVSAAPTFTIKGTSGWGGSYYRLSCYIAPASWALPTSQLRIWEIGLQETDGAATDYPNVTRTDNGQILLAAAAGKRATIKFPYGLMLTPGAGLNLNTVVAGDAQVVYDVVTQ